MDEKQFEKNTPHSENKQIDLESSYENAVLYRDSLDEPMEAEQTFFYCILVEAAFIVCIFFFSKWITEWMKEYSIAGKITLILIVFALGFLIGFTGFRIYQSRFGSESRIQIKGSGFMNNYESRSQGNLVFKNCLFATIIGTINVILFYAALAFLM